MRRGQGLASTALTSRLGPLPEGILMSSSTPVFHPPSRESSPTMHGVELGAAAPPTPSDRRALGCGRLDGQCVDHFVDADDTVIHHSAALNVETPNGRSLQFRLSQWGDEAPFLEIDDTDLELFGLDELLADLAQVRAHLAAAVAGMQVMQ